MIWQAEVKSQPLLSEGHFSPMWWQKPTAKWIIAPHLTLLPNYWYYWLSAALYHYLVERQELPRMLHELPMCNPTLVVGNTWLHRLARDASDLPIRLLNLCFPRSLHNYVRPITLINDSTHMTELWSLGEYIANAMLLCHSIALVLDYMQIKENSSFPSEHSSLHQVL